MRTCSWLLIYEEIIFLYDTRRLCKVSKHHITVASQNILSIPKFLIQFESDHIPHYKKSLSTQFLTSEIFLFCIHCEGTSSTIHIDMKF